LSRGTLWWLARHGNRSHYQLHNEYGLQHAKLVASNLQADRQIVLSAATFTGSGAVGGSHAHAQADVACTWSNMKTALETALGLGLAGVPLAGGGPVCGNMDDYDDELCTRLVDRAQTHRVSVDNRRSYSKRTKCRVFFCTSHKTVHV
jgi:alpha-glucosidase (family GH31 glycosyl hydrolase)